MQYKLGSIWLSSTLKNQLWQAGKIIKQESILYKVKDKEVYLPSKKDAYSIR